MRIPYGIRKRHIAWKYYTPRIATRELDLNRAKEKLKRDGWKEISKKYPFFLVKDRFKVDLDPDLTKIYWVFKGYDSVTYVQTPQITRYTMQWIDWRALVKKVKHLVREMSSLYE
ncbi:hypothetical protein DRP04_11760 [Archaeoglobales archaeon]|nr:MAG: hypothetical protein DRP04_11760 [Archaeoglobales archaeon]